MKVIKATDYGFRKVVQICLNPAEPEYIHRDGTAEHIGIVGHDAITHKPIYDRISIPARVKSGEVCHKCVTNWRTLEFVFSQVDLQRQVAEDVRAATDAIVEAVIEAEMAAGIVSLTSEAKRKEELYAATMLALTQTDFDLKRGKIMAKHIKAEVARLEFTPKNLEGLAL